MKQIQAPERALILSSSIIFLTILLTLFLYRLLPPEIPLWYGNPTGADQLGDRWQIFIPQGISVVINIINFFISKKTKNNLLIQVLLAVSVGIAFLAAFDVVKIIILIL